MAGFRLLMKSSKKKNGWIEKIKRKNKFKECVYIVLAVERPCRFYNVAILDYFILFETKTFISVKI